MTPSWPIWGRSATRYTVGVLVTAAIVFVLALPSEPAAWSVVALVVVLGATTGQSVTAAVNRMAGSIVGCLTGAIVQLSMPWLWLPLRVAVAVFACMLVCRLIRLTAGQRLGMALAGFFVFVPGDQEWATVGLRLLATLIGICVALIVALLLWPSSARDRLMTGIDGVLASISTSLISAQGRLHGAAPSEALAVGAVSTLRPLVAERRYEPPGKGPSANALSAILDGLDLAVAGVRRLDVACVVGPHELARNISADLDPIVNDLAIECQALQEALSKGEAPPPMSEANVDGRLSMALENLRAAHLTPAADAAELRDLFGMVEALSLTAQGLEQVRRQLG